MCGELGTFLTYNTYLTYSFLATIASDMRVSVIVGGTSEPSNSNMLADMFVEGLQEKGAKIVRFRLKDMNIEHFDIQKHYTFPPTGTDDYNLIEREIARSDAVVLACPIWNFSVPGNMKNFIDRLGAYGLDAETRSKGMFKGKPFYFVYTGGTPMTVWKTLMVVTTSHMQEALRYFGASVVGTYFEPRCTRGKGQFGLVVDQRPESLKTVREKGAAFAMLVENYAKTGKLPLSNAIVYKVLKFGYASVNKLVYMFS